MANKNDNDDRQEKACCIKWKQKHQNSEKGRRMLREGISILENELEKVQDQLRSLKSELEMSQKHAESERKMAEEERMKRIDLEKALESLTIEKDSIQKQLNCVAKRDKGTTHKDEKDKKKECSYMEELSGLRKQLEKVQKTLVSERKKLEDLKKQVDAEKKRADEEKRKADIAVKKYQEGKKIADLVNEKVAEQIRQVDTERLKYEEQKKQTDLERQRAVDEKKYREMLEKKLQDLELERQQSVDEKKYRETLEKKLHDLELERQILVQKKETTSKGKEDSLKKKLQRKCKALGKEKKVAEVERLQKEALEKEVSAIKERLEVGCQQLEIQFNKVAEEKSLRDSLERNFFNVKEELTHVTEILKLREIELQKTKEQLRRLRMGTESANMLLCTDHLSEENLLCKTSSMDPHIKARLISRKSPQTDDANKNPANSDSVPSEYGGCNPGTSSSLEPLNGGSVEKHMLSSGLYYPTSSFSDQQLIKSQDNDAVICSRSLQRKKYKRKNSLQYSRGSSTAVEQPAFKEVQPHEAHRILENYMYNNRLFSLQHVEDVMDSKHLGAGNAEKQSGEEGKKRTTAECIVDSISDLFNKEKRTINLLEEQIAVLKDTLKSEGRYKRKRGISSEIVLNEHLGDDKAKRFKFEGNEIVDQTYTSLNSHLYVSENYKEQGVNIPKMHEGVVEVCSKNLEKLEESKDNNTCTLVERPFVDTCGEFQFDFDFEKMFQADKEIEEQYIQASQCLLSPTLPKFPDNIDDVDLCILKEEMLQKASELQSCEITSTDKQSKDGCLHIREFKAPVRAEECFVSDVRLENENTGNPLISAVEGLVPSNKCSTSLSSEQFSSHMDTFSTESCFDSVPIGSEKVATATTYDSEKVLTDCQRTADEKSDQVQNPMVGPTQKTVHHDDIVPTIRYSGKEMANTFQNRRVNLDEKASEDPKPVDPLNDRGSMYNEQLAQNATLTPDNVDIPGINKSSDLSLSSIAEFLFSEETFLHDIKDVIDELPVDEKCNPVEAISEKMEVENNNEKWSKLSGCDQNQEVTEATKYWKIKHKPRESVLYMLPLTSHDGNFLKKMLIKISIFSTCFVNVLSEAFDLGRLILELSLDSTLSAEESMIILISVIMSSLVPIEDKVRNINSFCPNEFTINWSKNLIGQMSRVLSKQATKDSLLKIFPKDIMLRFMKKFLIEGKLEVYAPDTRNHDASIAHEAMVTEEGTFIHVSRTATLAEIRVGSILTCSLCMSLGHMDCLNEIMFDVFWWCTQDSFWLLSVAHSLFSLTWENFCQFKRNSLLGLSVQLVIIMLEGKEIGLSEIQHSDMAFYSKLQTSESSCINCPFRENFLRGDEVIALLVGLFEYQVTGDDNQEVKSRQYAGGTDQLGMRIHGHHFKEQSQCLNNLIGDLNDSMRSLELIAMYMGWNWTYNELVPKLWRMAQPYAPELVTSSLFLLLGNLGRLGIDFYGHEQDGVQTIRNNFSSFLEGLYRGGGNIKVTFSLQVAAAQSLIKLISTHLTAYAAEGDSSKASSDAYSMQKEVLKSWYSILSNEQKSLLPENLRADICTVMGQ